MSNTATILIVDDTRSGRETLEILLMSPAYELAFASSGIEALEKAAALTPDLILLDVMMPGMDGFEVCRRLRVNPQLAEVPIVMVTALDDRYSRLEGLKAGADDFLSKPLDRAELRARVGTITRLNRYRRLHAERAKFERLIDLSPDGILIVDESDTIRLANRAMRRILQMPRQQHLVGESISPLIASGWLEHAQSRLARLRSDSDQTLRLEMAMTRSDGSAVPVEVNAGRVSWEDEAAIQIIVRNITARKEAERQIRALNDELLLAYDATLEGWTRALELRDKETEGHTQRVTNMTMRLADVMGIPKRELTHIRRGALLHDIGKLGIPDNILLKPGPLTQDEWAIMRLHPVYAYEWLVSIAYLRPALDIPYCHHEKWDGTGYPRGLKGNNIPLPARMFAVVDIWDALRSERPYRASWPEKRVRDYICSIAGSHLDPDVVDAFMTISA